ncbi:TPA: hypothetical protein ACIVK2_000396 [Salmonella enterica subsp. enterica serovar 6,8:z4,z23:-]
MDRQATNQMQLVELYNAANTGLPHKLVSSEVKFGLPSANDDGEKNTKVTMTALPGSENFRGQIELKYDRLNPSIISDSLGVVKLEGEIEKWREDNYVRAYLQHYINRVKPRDTIATGDIVYSYEDVKEQDKLVTLRVTCTVAERNHKYLQGVMLVFEVSPEKIDLSTTNGELDGFKPTE